MARTNRSRATQPRALRPRKPVTCLQPRSIKSSEAELMASAIQWWICGAVPSPGTHQPDLKEVGFGRVLPGSGMHLVLDMATAVFDAAAARRASARAPIEVPPDGATVKYQRSAANGPIRCPSCTGYPQTAAAITLQLGTYVPARISNATLTQTTGEAAGKRVATCFYDSEIYTNADAAAQARAARSSAILAK